MQNYSIFAGASLFVFLTILKRLMELLPVSLHTKATEQFRKEH